VALASSRFALPCQLRKKAGKRGHLGAKTSKGIYYYGGRSEEEILKKRDRRYLNLLRCIEEINTFDPV
jgi:3-hydroxyacyl-CoA dehydrogenase